MSIPVAKFLPRFLIILSLSIAGCQFTDIRAILINNKSVKKIKEQGLEETQAGYLKALEIEPLLPALHSNLGATYDAQKDPDRAMRLYKNSEEFSEAEIKAIPEQWLISPWEKNSKYMGLFAALFNQAQLLGRENKLDDSLKKYQGALALNPTSKEVKQNIELMFQQQQGGGQGEGENKDKDKDQKGEGKGNGDDKDDKKDDKEKDGQKKDYSSSPKYKPRDFKGELTKENVSKIFGEISQQEKKMRSQFSKQNQTKEAPRDKDW